MGNLDQRNVKLLLEDEYREKIARIKAEYIPNFVGWAAELEVLDKMAAKIQKRMDAGETHLYGVPLKKYKDKLVWAVGIGTAAWKRNLDMSISDGGKGRAEIVTTSQNETGKVMPPEHGGSNGQNPIVVVQNGVKPAPTQGKSGWFAPLKK